jgi:hypothetical protein
MNDIKVCGDCAHWHKDDDGPRGERPPFGDCRLNPPSVSVLWTQAKLQGMPPVVGARAAHYPSLTSTYPACSQFKARVTLTT